MDRLDHVLITAGAAGRDDRYRYCCGNLLDEIEVVTGHGAVAIDRRKKDLAGAAVGQLPGPLHRRAAGVLSAGITQARQAAIVTTHVDARDDALRAESPGGIVHEVRF